MGWSLLNHPLRRIPCAAVALMWCLALVSNATRYCPQQKLVIARPDDLGVTHVTLLGEMWNSNTNKTDTVNYHAFVRIVRTENSNTTRVYGIGWVEGLETTPSYAPNHIPYLERLPQVKLQPLGSLYREIALRVNVLTTIGSKMGPFTSASWGFRLDATFESPDSFYEWRLEGWERSFPCHSSIRAIPGVICPWHAFDHPHSRCSPHHFNARLGKFTRQRIKAGGLSQPHDPLRSPHGGSQPTTTTTTTIITNTAGTSANLPVPLVGIVLFGRRPNEALRGNVYAAQQLIRHVEYHLGQLSMQRMIVYCSLGLLYDPIFRQYLERYMPAELLPHVTLVAWHKVSKTVDYYYDQHLKYYHAMVALWDYGNVLAAMIDPDEYIAYPGPQVTLWEALSRCNATSLDDVQLSSQQYTCESCLDQYATLPTKPGPKAGGTVDMDMWEDLAYPDARYRQEGGQMSTTATDNSSGSGVGGGGGTVSWTRQCRWWMIDPLSRYTTMWNDRWLLEQREFTAADLGTPKAWKMYLGKHMLRPEAARAFMHHRAEVMPGRQQAILDPTQCPHIAHLVHVNEYRPWGIAADIKYFKDPGRKAQYWWMVSENNSQQTA